MSGLSATSSQNTKHIVYYTTWVRVIRCQFSKHKTHCILHYLGPGYPRPVLKTQNTLYITLSGSELSAASSQNTKHIVYYTTLVRVIRCQFSKHKTHSILHYLGPGYPLPVLKTHNTFYITLPVSGVSAVSSLNTKHIVYNTTWVRVIRCQFSKHITHCILHYLDPGYPLPVLKTQNTLYITLPGSGLSATSSQNTKHIVYYTIWFRVIRCQFSKHKTHCILQYLGPGYPRPVLKTQNTLYITLPVSGLFAASSQNTKHIVYNTTWVRVIRCQFSKHKTHCILHYLGPGYPRPVLKTQNTLYITLPGSGLSAACSSKHKTHCILHYLGPGYPRPVLKTQNTLSITLSGSGLCTASSQNIKHIVYYTTWVRVIRCQFSKHKTHCILHYLGPGYPLPVLKT